MGIEIKVERVEDFDRLFRRDDDCTCHDEPKKEPKPAKPCGGQAAAPPQPPAPVANPQAENLAAIWKAVANALRSHGWTGAVKAHTPDGVAASVTEWLEGREPKSAPTKPTPPHVTFTRPA